MCKTTFLFLILLFSRAQAFAQCSTPISPPSCSGAEALLTDNETIGSGTSKWYYGATVTMNSLTMKGGTLVVCGNLTIDKFYIDSGTVFVRPGARLVIGSGIGAGLVLRGDSYFYNYGTLEIQRNLSLDNGWATALKPNKVINATRASIFKMSNQYLVINNTHSWFVNNGNAEFWGIITDPMAVGGSVCLGEGSSTRMAVLINKIADTYRVPFGNACLNVYQFSQFNNRLTPDPRLFACIGSSHVSTSGCGGCPANNWGAAQVITNCTSCGSLAVLAGPVLSLRGNRSNSENKLEWEYSVASREGYFIIGRSTNGRDFFTLDSVRVNAESTTKFRITDNNPLPGNNYYMIQYINPVTHTTVQSNTIKVITESPTGFSVHPVPFTNKFYVTDVKGVEKIMLTDMTGKNIPIRYSAKRERESFEIDVMQKIPSGIYIIHILTKTNIMAKTILKE
ncbi:MAG: T9SS type A sorting domain-containing protein [Chitinophagaceae bacterium]|nr:MAG: T9SS type A sorting domain-containing protein [Chitinophagaceae bacterium]